MGLRATIAARRKIVLRPDRTSAGRFETVNRADRSVKCGSRSTLGRYTWARHGRGLLIVVRSGGHSIVQRSAALYHAVANEIGAQAHQSTLDNMRLEPLRRLQIAEPQQFLDDLWGDCRTP